ncbi:MAG: hypothetical protein R3E48_15770 [Burkholderiaceae bacterium]
MSPGERAAFAYAQARLQAHHGRRLSDTDWRRLEASRGAAHYLAAARAGSLAGWLEAIGDADDGHTLEAKLNAAWTRHVDEVAGWVPVDWRAALRWFGTLIQLPIAARTDADAATRWLARWRAALPRAHRDADLLHRSTHLLLPRLNEAQAERDALAQAAHLAFNRLFRRHAGSPVAVLAALGLAALDFERLRGGLVARVLLAPERGAREADAS